VNPAAGRGRHPEASKQRTTEAKAEQHKIDNLGRMLFGSAGTEPCDFEHIRKHRHDQ
jgi:hypothetical protein